MTYQMPVAKTTGKPSAALADPHQLFTGVATSISQSNCFHIARRRFDGNYGSDRNGKRWPRLWIRPPRVYWPGGMGLSWCGFVSAWING